MNINSENSVSLTEFKEEEAGRLADNEDMLEISKRLIEKNKEAYEELAK